jgi:hypothetical protein
VLIGHSVVGAVVLVASASTAAGGGPWVLAGVEGQHKTSPSRRGEVPTSGNRT